MTCANHPDAAAAAYCRTCGKPLCTECKREAEGTIFCVEHLPVASAAATGAAASMPYTTTTHPIPPLNASPYTAPQSAGGPIPFLAFLLGFIPGVGAIYNGQYAKGLTHAVIFGILVSILSNSEHSGRYPGIQPLLGILLAAWVFYMAFEAYHTAKNRRDGVRGGEDVSSLLQMDRSSGRFPIGALVLIVIGGLLLLDTTNLISIDRLLRLWPVGLILVGAYLLYDRMTPPPRVPEARDDLR